MHIDLSPVRMDMELAATVAGETLTINGIPYDLSGIIEPTEIVNGWFAGPVVREGGRLRLTLVLPLPADAPEAARFPSPIIDPPDGPLALPDTAPEEAEPVGTAAGDDI